MSVEWQDVAIALTATGSAIIGWLVRELWDAIKQLRRDLSELQNSLPNVYARRDDVREMFEQLLRAVESIHVKIDGKADKHYKE